MDGLKEQQSADTELHMIRGCLKDPVTVPDGNELCTHSTPVQYLWAQHQSLEMKEGLYV